MSSVTVLVGSSIWAEEGSAVEFELSPYQVWSGGLEWESGVAMEQLADRLAGDVRIDLQSRGGDAYQADIVARGGTFENTGISIGGLNLFDPQTGHYMGELPLSMRFFGAPELLTGLENGLRGFNSSVATVRFNWQPIRDGGEVNLLVGGYGWLEGELIQGGSVDEALSYQVSIGGGSGNGTVDAGDFEFERVSGRLELQLNDRNLLRFFGGYVRKDYGWPALYTGIAALEETDDYAVGLLGLIWQVGNREDAYWEVGAYWRSVKDDYGFSPNPRNDLFEHETEVLSLQGEGAYRFDKLGLRYDWVLLKDRLKRSTALTFGNFDERDYGKFSAVTDFRLMETTNRDLTLSAGLSVETTSEDSTVASPQVELRHLSRSSDFQQEQFISFSRTSQVPGYTALNSNPVGLFGGNGDLSREKASVYEAGYSARTDKGFVQATVFYREDRDLADWTFNSSNSSRRQANPVDLDVWGFEGQVRYAFGWADATLGYAYLNKDEDYGSTLVDASYYALNFAKHRVNLIIEGQIESVVNWKLQAEYRDQVENALRTSSDEAFLLSFMVGLPLEQIEGLSIQLFGENLTDEDFQIYPGTPASGPQWSAVLNYLW